MPEGENKLQSAEQCAEQILNHTAPAGHPRINNDVSNMKQDFTDLQVGKLPLFS